MTDAPAASAPISILLLEDHGVVRSAMRAAIQASEPRARICEASSYAEAVEQLKAEPIDIAFLDIDLREEKSGLDVLIYLQKAELETKAIMLSARDDRDIILQCLSHNASGYIPKAMDGEGVFRRALDAVFQGGVFLPNTALGRGAYTPSVSNSRPGISADTIVSGRLLETLYYICQGLQYKIIAHKMGISESTVRQNYATTLLQKFGVISRVELVVEISRRGVIVPKPPDLTAET